MHATVSLKQLRTDPRRLVQLLNRGYQIDITDHRQIITTAHPPEVSSDKPQPGTAGAILAFIDSLPPPTPPLLDPDLDTVTAVKMAKNEYFEKKYGPLRTK